MEHIKTHYYVEGGVIFNPSMQHTGFYITDDGAIHGNSGSTHYYTKEGEQGRQKIYSPSGQYTEYFIDTDSYIYGASTTLPWM